MNSYLLKEVVKSVKITAEKLVVQLEIVQRGKLESAYDEVKSWFD